MWIDILFYVFLLPNRCHCPESLCLTIVQSLTDSNFNYEISTAKFKFHQIYYFIFFYAIVVFVNEKPNCRSQDLKNVTVSAIFM
jgi:hypothetical protein